MSCPSSIWRQDSNSQPLEHESPPITTRPGLPPKSCGKRLPFILLLSSYIVKKVPSDDSFYDITIKTLNIA